MPTRGLINPELLTDIADAIRAKNGTSAGMTPAQMAEAISNLELSEAIKQALLNCFAHVAWIDDQGQTYYDALEDALYPTAPPAELLSISAVFEQGQTVIYDTDSLDDLKPMLTVTAHYSDSTSAVVVGYTLSGTLTAGTSTITVSYGGKTATFDVTVTATPILYSLENRAFNNEHIATGVFLKKEDVSFSVAMDLSITTEPTSGAGSQPLYVSILNAALNDFSLSVGKQTANAANYKLKCDGVLSSTDLSRTGAGRLRFVVWHESGSGKTYVRMRKDTDAVTSAMIEHEYVYSNNGTRLGQTSSGNLVFALPTGTINKAIIYGMVISDSAINEFLGL